MSESFYVRTVHQDGKFLNIGLDFLANGIALITQILTTYFLTYVIIPKLFTTANKFPTLILFIIGSYLICILSRFLNLHIIEPAFGETPKSFETTVELFSNLFKLTFLYFFRNFSIAFIFAFLKMLKDQNEIQKKTLILEKQKVETELKLLKTQLNPHFLFNTLNNIYSLSLMSSKATTASIGRLSDILDYILYQCNAAFVPLNSEINLLKNYIELEKLRYDERLQVNFKTTIDHDITIAPLLLLSIVENAFKHGAGNDMENPVICIDLKVEKSVFEFTVTNSFTPKDIEAKKDKIGLSNLEQQLNLLYPQKYLLKVEQKNFLFIVTLIINLATK